MTTICLHQTPNSSIHSNVQSLRLPLHAGTMPPAISALITAMTPATWASRDAAYGTLLTFTAESRL